MYAYLSGCLGGAPPLVTTVARGRDQTHLHGFINAQLNAINACWNNRISETNTKINLAVRQACIALEPLPSQ